MLDTPVAQSFATIRDADKGPRPYFTDNLNPPLGVDRICFEGSLDELHEEAGSVFPSEEGEEWEAQAICGDRREDDGVLELLPRLCQFSRPHPRTGPTRSVRWLPTPTLVP